MQILAKHNREKVIDLLTERLAFERASVKLYDSTIAKMHRAADPGIQRMTLQVQEFRDQEKEHEDWLEEQIRTLGGDAQGTTEWSTLAKVESKGIENVVLDDDQDISHIFHALFTAELVDNASWEILVQLADEADDEAARRAFRVRLHEEEEHLTFLRRAVAAFARTRVLGRQSTVIA